MMRSSVKTAFVWFEAMIGEVSLINLLRLFCETGIDVTSKARIAQRFI
jgi:hypothetical protein